VSTGRHSWQIVKAGVGEMTLYVVPGPSSNADRLEALEEILRLATRENDALAQGFADAEALIAEGLRKMAEAEDGAARLARLASRSSVDEANARYLRHEARSACLREAALAVSVGQFRDVPKGE
jgi:hypothetical protein